MIYKRHIYIYIFLKALDLMFRFIAKVTSERRDFDIDYNKYVDCRYYLKHIVMIDTADA